MPTYRVEYTLKDSSVPADMNSGAFDIEAENYDAAETAAAKEIVFRLNALGHGFDVGDASIQIVET
jgi:hypothetical protein